MLARIDIENWMSFRDRVSFSMLATRERQYRERIPQVGKYSAQILPVAAVYGGNASGKSNFVRALAFLQRIVAEGSKPDAAVAVEPFRLDAAAGKRPTNFSVELLIGTEMYEYSISLDHHRIREEKLVHIRPASERTLFHRIGDDISFHPSLEEAAQLNFTFRGTRSNQLFLTNSVAQNLAHFKNVHDWFRNQLVILAPDSRYVSQDYFVDPGSGMTEKINSLLNELDTGISHFGGKEVPLGNVPVSDEMRERIVADIRGDKAKHVFAVFENDRYSFAMKRGKLSARKLMSYHESSDGSRIPFDMNRESDGSRRLLDILPAIVMLMQEQNATTFIIDELDRSLHTLVTRRLLEQYLASCSGESRGQLLFTTHDVLLMDQDLLRRDEMWVTERDSSGASALYSFSEFKDVRYDKDIRKSYLLGRLGGIPRMLLTAG